MKKHPITETEIRAVMSNLLTDLKSKAPAHKKWIEWKDERTGLIVGEYQ